MILIEEVSRNWERDGKWRIAPAGLAWIAEGHRIIVGNGACIGNDALIGNDARIGDDACIGNDARIGNYAHIGNGANIGNGAHIGNYASEAIDIGFADGFRKCIANVKGVAYIGAGCRWFTLDEAIKHWESHDENRDLTLCLMRSAIHIARLKGWAFSEAEQ